MPQIWGDFFCGGDIRLPMKNCVILNTDVKDKQHFRCPLDKKQVSRTEGGFASAFHSL